MTLLKATADFVTTTTSTALAIAGTTMTIGTGLDLPATNGLLQIHYDSAIAVGTDEGPETVKYASYNSGTGAIAGMTRGVAGTTDVAHASGATVQCAPSTGYGQNASAQTVIGDNEVRAVRYVAIDPTAVVSAVDPADTDWYDVDVTAQTSANTYAVTGTVGIRATTAGRYMYLRENGSAATGASTIVTASPGANTYYSYNSFNIGTDSGQIFEYSVSNADVLFVNINITGYFEYVD